MKVEFLNKVILINYEGSQVGMEEVVIPYTNIGYISRYKDYISICLNNYEMYVNIDNNEAYYQKLITRLNTI